MTAGTHQRGADPASGRTVPEVAAMLRVSEDKVRAWIRAGELEALDVGTAARPRLVILPRHLAALEERRRVATPQPRRARRKPRVGQDYYAD